MSAANTGSVGAKTVIGAGWLVAWRMATRGLGLASTLILARILVPEDFGLLAMATAFSAAIDAMSSMGLLDALVRSADSEPELLDTAFTMQAMRGLVTAGVICLGAWPASVWFNEPRLMPILLVLAGLAAASGFENIGIVEYRRALRFSMEFRLLFLPRISQFVFVVASAWIFRSYWVLVAGMAIAKLARLAMTYAIHPYRPSFSLARWRGLVGFSFWTWASGLAALVWERFDPFILGRMVGSSALAIYIISSEIAVLPVTELVAPATSALFAGIAASQNRSGGQAAGQPFAIASTLLLLIMPLGIAISGTSGYIVAATLGQKWLDARPLIAIFAWTCALYPFSFVGTAVLTARAQVRQNFVVQCVASISKMILIYSASLTHDLSIIAIAATCCVVVESSLFTVQLMRNGEIFLPESLMGILRTILSSMIVSALLYQTHYAWQTSTLSSGPALIVGAVVGILTILCFAAVQLILWRLSGGRDGPEAFLLRISGHLTENIFSRRKSSPDLAS